MKPIMSSSRNTLILLSSFFAISYLSQTQAHADTPSTVPDQNKFALMVGVDKYQSPDIEQLSGAVKDIKGMQQTLINNFKFPKENIVLLLDENATKAAIVNTFKKHLIENARKYKDDGIYVFEYSGHGSQVKDTDGDETDGWDETLVPYDSRSDDKYDITDDELDELVQALNKETKNVFFILDSCHSGTGTRGIGKIRAIKRDTRPQPPRAGKSEPPKTAGQMIRARDSYVALSGCAAAETSAEADDGQGLMTKNLILALKAARKGITFQELWQDISSSVTAERPEQHPQIEGDITRVLFADSSQRVPQSYAVKTILGSDKKSKKLQIGAGQVLGLKEGTVVGIYKADSDLLSDQGVLAKGSIKNVAAFSCDLPLPDTADLKTFSNARAVIITPNFGTKFRVGSETAKISSTFIDNIKTGLDTQPVVQLVPSISQPEKHKDNWDLLLVEDTKNRFSTLVNPDKPDPSVQKGFFIMSKSGQPLYNLFASSNDPARAAKLIKNALVKFAKQENLRALKNTTNDLSRKVKVEFVRVGPKPSDGSDAVEISNPTDQISMPKVKLGERLRLKIKNESDQDLFVSVLALDPSGEIAPLFVPRDPTEAILKGVEVVTPILKAEKPAGLATLKLIISTEYIDCRFLAQSAVVTRSGPTVRSAPVNASVPLQRLLCDGLGLPRTRGISVEQESNNTGKLSSWNMRNIDVLVIDPNNSTEEVASHNDK